MCFSFEPEGVAERLEKLVKNPEDHHEHRAAQLRNSRQGAVFVQLNPLQFAQRMADDEQTIANLMQADVERLRITRSNIIPTDVMNQVFELLSVTREQVRTVLEFAAKSAETPREARPA